MLNEAGRKIEKLRALMLERGIDIYIVPTSDSHESEEVGEYFRARKYLTGFSGSAGTAVVAADGAWLWTDGRYFIQAERELSGSGISLMRQGETGVPAIEEFVRKKLLRGGVIGFDAAVMNTCLAKKYEKIAKDKQGSLYVGEDLVGLIWEDRPGLSDKKIMILPDKLSGETAGSKLSRIRKEMTDKRADAHLVSSLCDIAWILNLRGFDIIHTPVFLSYLLITMDEAFLFVRDDILTKEVRRFLAESNVSLREYGEVYEALKAIDTEEMRTILLDENVVNFRLYNFLPPGIKVINSPDPSVAMKAVKNETETALTREAHIRDGAIVTKFMYWLKTHVGKEEITEFSAGEHLDSLRAKDKDYIDLCFDTISAYGPNAAMMHYSASSEGSAKLSPRGLYLVDSGAHYLGGTTDITRTIALGPLSPMEKKHFTAVAKAVLRLQDAKFLYGCSGLNLDILARGILWDLDLDYKCGTGHGVGHILNVHEGPNGFRWKKVPERIDSGTLEPGMITSDEPGVYLEDKYGIRIENELLCVEDTTNEYGRFLKFECLTYAPIDLDAIDPDELDASDIKRLNQYHAMVYQKLSPYLTDDERGWLAHYTRPLPGRP